MSFFKTATMSTPTAPAATPTAPAALYHMDKSGHLAPLSMFCAEWDSMKPGPKASYTKAVHAYLNGDSSTGYVDLKTGKFVQTHKARSAGVVKAAPGVVDNPLGEWLTESYDQQSADFSQMTAGDKALVAVWAPALYARLINS